METNKEPSLIDKAKSLGTAAVDWAVKDKFQRVSDEVFSYRKSICITCPYWKPDAYNNLGACGKCGCSVGKLHLPHSRCPDNPPRWNAISTGSSNVVPTTPPVPTPTPINTPE